MNKNLLLGAALMLSACSGGREAVTAEYRDLSCQEIKDEYRRVLQVKVDAFNQRMRDNDTNLLVTATLNAITKSGQTEYDSGSLSEADAEIRLAVLRKCLEEKNCVKNCS